MPIINIICPICTEIFKNADEVFSTVCGHLFHYICLNDWLARDQTCPQCRKRNPTYHKLQLSFMETERDSKTESADIEVQLKSSEEKVAQLLNQTQQLEDDFLKLQNQYSLTDSANRELEIKLSQLNNDAEANFLNLQAQYTDIAEMRKQFEDHINQLCVENESILKELQITTDENEEINSDMEAGHLSLSNNVLNEKIKGLEHKLKYATKELQKEINLNTELSVDKMRLESCINNYRSSANVQNAILKEKNSNSSHNKAAPNHVRRNSPENLNRYARSVFIKGLPSTQIKPPFKNVVLNLALKMNIALISDDLDEVNIMTDDSKNSDYAILCVVFKEIETKNAFLSNSDTLQDDARLHPIVVEDFMSTETHELFVYAKRNLHNCGLIYFYIENNQVFAKKNRMHSEKIHIQCKNHVARIAANYNLKKILKN